MRMNASDVVSAYKDTGIIPIRKAWNTGDGRGGCPFDALARTIGVESGEIWSSGCFDPEYVEGFNDAWDADEPKALDQTTKRKKFLIGYWDAVLCREAVEKAFSSVPERTTL